MTSDILHLDATTLSRRIAAREIRCVDLMSATLARIAERNPVHNAIVSLRDADELMAEARTRDDQLARGEHLGWMHGFPIAVKDLIDVRGLPTSKGSLAVPRAPAAEDALVVARMRNAGAIFIGKTNTPEFGLGSHTFNQVFGITRNAFDAQRSAGGSSGGAAVALATRMLPLADGSDMGGSLRNPAAWNNVVGFRPSRGRVPTVPADDAFFQQLSTEGPMGRTVEDTTRLLCTLAGWDDRAPLSLAETLPAPSSPEIVPALRGKRVGWLGSIWPELPLEAGVADLCTRALDTMQGQGWQVEHCTLDIPRERSWRAWLHLRQMLVGGRLASVYNDPAKRDLLKPEAVWEAEQSQLLDAAKLYQASVDRTAVYHAFRRLFERYDFVAAPSAQVFAFPAELHWPRSIAGVSMDTYHRWMEIVTPFTLAGLPVVSVPVGFDAQGRAMGMQLAGPARSDMAVLAAAAAFEQVQPWVHRLPS